MTVRQKHEKERWKQYKREKTEEVTILTNEDLQLCYIYKQCYIEFIQHQNKPSLLTLLVDTTSSQI